MPVCSSSSEPLAATADGDTDSETPPPPAAAVITEPVLLEGLSGTSEFTLGTKPLDKSTETTMEKREAKHQPLTSFQFMTQIQLDNRVEDLIQSEF